jgi:hypothetical protein
LLLFNFQEYYVAFNEVDAQLNVRNLTSDRIGTLIRITGQVVRTHPVHPELVLGTFICADCQTVISGVEQQFKYTQPSICRNPVVSFNNLCFVFFLCCVFSLLLLLLLGIVGILLDVLGDIKLREEVQLLIQMF